MNIPETLRLKSTQHGSGAKGMAFYGYEDTGGLGVRMEARRPHYGAPFIETWFYDGLPNREFKTFDALCEAVRPMTEAEIEAATVDAYPLIRDLEPDSCGNACRLCPRPAVAFDAAGERVKHDTWRLHLYYSWKSLTGVSLCNDHMTQYESDPKGLRDALEAEVAARRERVRLKNGGV